MMPRLGAVNLLRNAVLLSCLVFQPKPAGSFSIHSTRRVGIRPEGTLVVLPPPPARRFSRPSSSHYERARLAHQNPFDGEGEGESQDQSPPLMDTRKEGPRNQRRQQSAPSRARRWWWKPSPRRVAGWIERHSSPSSSLGERRFGFLRRKARLPRFRDGSSRRSLAAMIRSKWTRSSSASSNNGIPTGPQQPPRRRHRRRRRAATVALWGAILSWRLTSLPAHAKYSYELTESPTLSIRPGMSSHQVDELQATGELPPPPVSSDGATETAPDSAFAKKQAARAKKNKKDSVYGDYYDEDDDMDLVDEEAAVGTLGGVVSASSSYSSSSTGSLASQRDKVAAARLAAATKSSFAARHQGKSTALTAKVSAALFVPTFGGMFVREFLRRRREEEYVRKGLEILEAQKAEYFNVTSTSSDSDVQDALKGLKNKNRTRSDDDDDEDDDDDDEDDDDDKPQPKMRRSPRTPPKGDGGGGGGTGGSSSGGPSAGGKSSDPGYGKASDEDIDKLKRLMGRS